MTEENKAATFEILESRRPEAEALIETLRKKGKKYGCDSIDVEWGEVSRRKESDGFGNSWTVSYRTVTVSGEAPRVGDHKLVARMTHEENAVLIDAVPNHEVEKRFRAGTKVCEHCNTTRNRKNMFIVEDGAGEQIQVGRSCLRDHLGIDDPKRALQKFAWLLGLSENEELFSMGRRSPSQHALSYVIELSVASARQHGFWSHGAVNKIADAIMSGERSGSAPKATSSRVFDVVNIHKIPRDEYNIDRIEKANELAASVTPEDKEKAAEITEWVRAIDAQDAADYIYNLTTIFANEMVHDGRLGLACSAVGAWSRENEKREEKANAPQINHVGTVGERLRNIEAEVIAAIYIGESNWGERYLYKFATPNNGQLTWFTTSKGLNEGDKVSISATVKEHGEYQGQNQTLVSRAKVEELVN